MAHWLVKTEPQSFSFADLLAESGQTTPWEGVRNYQARNFMRGMRLGDGVLIYHSSTARPGVAGLAAVASESYPDPTQFDPTSPYFDPKATIEAPRWYLVEIRALRALPRLVPLTELRADPQLQRMRLLERGNRLSVMPLTAAEFARVLELAEN